MLGLALEGLVEQLAAEGVAELHHQLLQFGEGRAPGGPLRPVEVVQQVFRRGEQDRAQLGRDLYGTCLLGHVELLSAVALRRAGGLADPILGPPEPACKPCRAPASPGAVALPLTGPT